MATITSNGFLRRMMWYFKMTWNAANKRMGGLVVASWFVLTTVLLALIALLFVQAMQLKYEGERAAVAQTRSVSRPVITMDSKNDLQRFQAYLLPHEDIPEVLSLMIGLAAGEGLQLAKGEYKVQADQRGKFMRYRMSFPVQGEAPKIEQFIHKALAQHKTLALESVQFKRERVDALGVEAKMDWVLMTNLPQSAENVFKSDGGAEVKP